jgi:hypothetical protein
LAVHLRQGKMDLRSSGQVQAEVIIESSSDPQTLSAWIIDLNT